MEDIINSQRENPGSNASGATTPLSTELPNNYDKAVDNSEYTKTRDVTLQIAPEPVLEAFRIINQQLENFAGFSNFSINDAWKSSNSAVFANKINEINTSFTTIKTIINNLTAKVNGYVDLVKKSDEIKFNNNTTDEQLQDVE